MVFREAEIEDITAIVGLLANDKLGRKREAFTSPLPEAYMQAFERITADPNQKLMVAINDQMVVGTFQLSFLQYLTYQGGIRAQIEAVRVHENYRGQGLGKILIEKAIDMSKEEGAHVVQLTTDKQRPDALKFYESLGFVASHEGMKLHIK